MGNEIHHAIFLLLACSLSGNVFFLMVSTAPVIFVDFFFHNGSIGFLQIKSASRNYF